MNKIFWLLLLGGLLVVLSAERLQAQTTRDVENKEFEKRSNSRKSKSKLKARSYVESQKDFEKRMKKVAKEHRKKAKAMKKPQYSDPTYFGHRRPPKIRPVGKRKLCKECGIVH